MDSVKGRAGYHEENGHLMGFVIKNIFYIQIITRSEFIIFQFHKLN